MILTYFAKASSGCGASSTLYDTSCLAKPAHSEIQLVLQIVFAVIGAMAILMLTIAGLQYITSGGDSQKMAKAKDTILYALVGTIIVIVAEAAVTFLLGHV